MIIHLINLIFNLLPLFRKCFIKYYNHFTREKKVDYCQDRKETRYKYVFSTPILILYCTFNIQ